MEDVFLCTSCFLANRKPHMLPPQHFGAYRAEDIPKAIGSQGMWARCLACGEAAAKLRGTGKPEGLHVLEAAPGEGIVCRVCKKERPLAYYNESAVKNRTRPKQQELGATCNACIKLQRCQACEAWKATKDFRYSNTHCNACVLLRCSSCNKKQGKEQFSRTAWYNGWTHKRNVACISCEKTGRSTKSAENRQGQRMCSIL